jgi:iron complex outermembrane receptor protein
MVHFKAALMGVGQTVICILLLLSVAHARADDAVARPFDIGRQNLATALSEFARQSQQEILYSPEVVAEKLSSGLHGTMQPLAALRILLKDSGLSFSTTRNGAILIGKPTAPGATVPSTSSNTVEDDPHEVHFSVNQAGERSPYDRFRLAQSDQGQTRSESPPGPALQEVVVTAQRREERSLDVPVAVTALNSEDLRARNVQTAQDLQNYIPSLSVSSSVTRDDYTFSLRGMGPTGGSGPGAVLGGGGTGVVAYFAEVPTTAAGPGLFYDLENVQVAAGPQGTLFGKNTTGGAVLFVPRRPNNDLEGSIEVGGGNYSMKTATIAANLPVISDKLLVRFAGQVLDRDGFTVDRGPLFPGKDYDNRDYWALRLSVLFRPLEDLENYTIFSAFHSNEHGDGFVLSDVDPGGAHASQLVPIFAGQQAAGVRSTALSADEIDRRYNYAVINTTRWSISDRIQFKNIFSYQVQKWRNSEDVDGTVLVLDDLIAPRAGGWHTQVGTYTEEPQLQGTALDGKLTFTAGAYYEDGRNIAPQPYEVDVAEGGFVIKQANQSNSERSRGLYGQTSYDLGGVSAPLSGLKLTTGYRYTWDDYSYGIAAYSPTAGNLCLTSSGNYPQSDCSFAASGKSHGSSWTLGLAYQWHPDQLLYVRSGRGYVPGGFNPSFGFTPGGVHTPQFTFAPESVTDVELGMKSAFAVGSARGEVDADVFHSNFTNIQRYVGEVLPGGVESNFTANASEAEIEGFEFQGRVAPTNRLTFAATYSYNHGKYTRIDPAAAPSLVGVPFAYLPAHKASLSASYVLPLPARLGEISTMAFYSYQSRFFDAPSVQPLDYIEGYGLLNARIDWRNIAQTSLDVAFSVTNATDRTYRVGQYSSLVSNGYITSFYGEPRMFVVSLRYLAGGR